MNGDGRLDLVAVVNDGVEFSSFEFDAAGQPALGKVNKIDSFTIKQGVQVLVGDLDGDGRADDLAAIDGGASSLLINETDTKGGYRVVAVALPGTTAAAEDEILVGDTDGDGVDNLFLVLTTKHDTAKNSIGNIR
jgi:hypothetical protein